MIVIAHADGTLLAAYAVAIVAVVKLSIRRIERGIRGR